MSIDLYQDDIIEALTERLNAAEVVPDPDSAGGYLWRTSQDGPYGWQPVTQDQINWAARKLRAENLASSRQRPAATHSNWHKLTKEERGELSAALASGQVTANPSTRRYAFNIGLSSGRFAFGSYGRDDNDPTEWDLYIE